jgi:hypothetical protein
MAVVPCSIQSWTAINVSEKERSSVLAVHTAEHPLLFHSVAPFVLAPIELALIDFDACKHWRTQRGDLGGSNPPEIIPKF